MNLRTEQERIDFNVKNGHASSCKFRQIKYNNDIYSISRTLQM